MRQCLIVEAEPDDRERLQALFADHGFEVRASQDARAALDECRRWSPDVLLVSQRLSSMDAVAFVQRLRRQPGRRAPVVLLLGEDQDPVEIGRAIWEGASECLMKPYDADVLDLKLRQTGIV